jgi:hypothetical protein
MTSYECITRDDLEGRGEEALHIADETNCVQWILVPREPRKEPFSMPCFNHRGEPHQWRTAWVIA